MIFIIVSAYACTVGFTVLALTGLIGSGRVRPGGLRRARLRVFICEALEWVVGVTRDVSEAGPTMVLTVWLRGCGYEKQTYI